VTVAFEHASVLVDETLEHLAPRAGGRYVDGTVGGGGHAEHILTASSPDGVVIGLDRDEAALAAARERLAPFGDRARLVHARFAEMPEVLASLSIPAVDGILLDLGVSSPQLDVAERGFSFSRPGPLDMRMDASTEPSLATYLATTSVDELERVIRAYGEERYAGRIARAIHEALREGALATTTDLARVVARAMPPGAARRDRIDPATRTFQGLRIAVNQELSELERFLSFFPDLLSIGGRCVIIAFHSLEDRPVKERFRDLEWTSRLPPDLAAATGERTVPVCRQLTRKPVTATDAEVARNPRARSAKLRACERT
jgi:16S rRNA (cytosine1402-N4)-methyltransferase